MTTDGTVNAQDASAKKQDTSAEEQGTSKTKTYTESEVQKIKNDALAQAGRDAKALEQKAADLKEREDAHAQWQRERDEEEYEKARGNPEALSALQRERADRATSKSIKEERDALERERVAFQVEKDTANAIKKEHDIAELAEKYQIPVQVLKDLDLDVERTEKVAQRLTTLSPEALGKTTPAIVPKKRDSGVTLGGGNNLSGLKPKEVLKEIQRKLSEN